MTPLKIIFTNIIAMGGLVLVGCSLQVDDHTHEQGATSNAVIVSIDRPVEEGAPDGPNIDDKINIGA